MTQHEFAGRFGLPVATLRHWERGNRNPTGTALVLLSVIRENPRVVMQAVLKVRRHTKKSYRAPPGFGERRRWRY